MAQSADFERRTSPGERPRLIMPYSDGLLGGFSPLQSATLNEAAAYTGATPMQVALAWLMQRTPNMLLIPGTSTRVHLRENMAAADIQLSEEVLAKLDGVTKDAKRVELHGATASRH